MIKALRARWSVVALIAIACVLSLLYYAWTWSTELGDFGGDNAIYLLTAQYLSPWSESSPVAAYFATHSQYPPLYPLVLAIFGGAESLLVAHIITTTALLLAFATFYFWLRQLKYGSGLAASFTTLFALLPGTYMNALSVLSENLYLFATLLSLFAATRFEDDREQFWLWVAVAGVVAAALTRGSGISLTAAFILYLLIKRPARYRVAALCVVLPVVLWGWLGPHAGTGYVTSLLERYAPDPMGVLFSQLQQESRAIWIGWAKNFTSTSVGLWLLGIIGGICLTGTVRRAWVGKLDALYVVAYLGLIMIWPFPAEAQRFILVIIPILLVHGVLMLDSLPTIKVTTANLRPSVVLLLALGFVGLPTLLLTGQRFLQPIPKEFYSFKRVKEWYALDARNALVNVANDKIMTDHMRSISAELQSNECIYSIKPSITAYYANRISIIPPRPQLDQQAFHEYLVRTGCRFFYLVGFASSSFHAVYYPIKRLHDSLKIISVARLQGEAAPAGIFAEYDAR